jgi:hypothetical protein
MISPLEVQWFPAADYLLMQRRAGAPAVFYHDSIFMMRVLPCPSPPEPRLQRCAARLFARFAGGRRCLPGFGAAGFARRFCVRAGYKAISAS